MPEDATPLESADRTWLTELNQLWSCRGNPSLRQIAGPAGLAHTTVSDVLKGKRLPSLPTLLSVARALGGDEGTFIALWQEANIRSLVESPAKRASERDLLFAILEELRAIRRGLESDGPTAPSRGRRSC